MGFFLWKNYKKRGKIKPRGKNMPTIRPMRDLKNTAAISTLCHETEEPIFITKNGYGDMVVMSIETYEKTMFINNVYNKLEEAKQDIKNKELSSVENAVDRIKLKYGL